MLVVMGGIVPPPLDALWYCTSTESMLVLTQPALLVVQLPVVTYYADTKAIVHHICVFL